MALFLLLLIAFFIMGVALRNSRPGWRLALALLAALLLTFVYFTLERFI